MIGSMRKMNIKDAQRLYGEIGEFIRGDISNIANKMGSSCLINDTYFHALEYTDLMFYRTLSNIRMFSGGDGDGFLSTLRVNFERALAKIKKAKGLARIILVNNKIPPALKEIQDIHPDVLKIIPVRVEDGIELSHYIVCDDNMLRDEKLHDILTPETDIKGIKASVYFDNKTKTQAFIERFDDLWRALSS